MIKKRKLRNKPYYKVYDTDYPYVIVYCTLEEANELIHALGGIHAEGV